MRSIAGRLGLVIVLVTGIALSAAGGGMAWVLYRDAEAALGRQADAAAARLARAVVEPLWTVDAAGARAQIDAELLSGAIAGAVVREADANAGSPPFAGRILATAGPGDATELPTLDDLRRTDVVEREGRRLGTVEVQVDRAPHLARLRRLVLGMLVGIAAVESALVIVLVIALRRTVVRPLAATVAVLESMAAGNATCRLPESGTREMIRLAVAVNRTIDGMRRTLAAASEQAMHVAGAADGLSAIGDRMRGAAVDVRERADHLAVSTRELATSIRSVAESSSQLDQEAHHIIQEAQRLYEASDAAGERLGDTGREVERLAATAQEIGVVMAEIRTIADQTNLLALNAAIEAAQAGEFGRGFAVVAGEVKALAARTVQASHGVEERIAAIRVGVAAVVEGLGAATAARQRMVELQGVVSAAMERQTATASSIALVVEVADTGVHEMAESAAGMAQAAGTAAESADATNAAALGLQERVVALRHLA